MLSLVPAGFAEEGWLFEDVGTGGGAGSSAFDSAQGSFSITGASGNIGGMADRLAYSYRALKGDGQIVVRVASLQSANSGSVAGLIIRDNLTAGSINAGLLIPPVTDIRPTK